MAEIKKVSNEHLARTGRLKTPQIPRFGTSFVGREEELSDILASVKAGRLVTMLGPGGSGKTRIAAMAADFLAADWPDGTWWIGLDETLDEATVFFVVATALGIATTPATEQLSVVEAIAGSRRLIVLDNCEHVRGGVAAFVDGLLAAVPTVSVLATSRAPIGLAGEHLYRIGPLQLHDAINLFSIRVEAFGTPRPDAIEARRICDRIDRLPLALELAAGWTTTLSTGEIVTRLAQPLDILESPESRAPYRLRSLVGSVKWSHALLDDACQTVFRRLGVFRSGFTVEQAQAVCVDDGIDPLEVLRCLRALVNMSLLVSNPETSPARLGMFEVIAAFARERLSESGEEVRSRNRHLAAYLHTVEGLVELRDTDKDAWRAALAPEYANLIAAIEWGVTGGNLGDARELAIGLSWLWHLESRRPEGIALLTAVAHACLDEGYAAQARTEVALALVADTAAPGSDHRDRLGHALRIAVEQQDNATAHLARILLALHLIVDDPGMARTLAVENEVSAVEAGDVFNVYASKALLGILACMNDEYGPAMSYLESSAVKLRQRGDRGVAATALGYLALAHARTGSLDKAIQIAQESIECARPLQDLHRIGQVSVTYAELLALRGRIGESHAVFDEICPLMDGMEGPGYVPGWELTRGRIAAWEGRFAEAIEWCERGIHLAELGNIHPGALRTETQLELASAHRLSGNADLASEILAKVRCTIDEASRPRLRAELEEQAAFLADDPETAYALHHEALRIRAEAGLTLDVIDSLENIAAIAISHRTPEFAVTLAAAAQTARDQHDYVARRIHTNLQLATMMADPAYAEDVNRGRALGSGAVDYARRMRGSRNRPTTGWESLTPTEKSVAELAAEGHSNPKIAERLFVSRGTVKTHLEHIYQKLGIANRTELAAVFHSERRHNHNT